MDKQDVLEYSRLKTNFHKAYQSWQAYPSAVRNRAWDKAQEHYETFINKMSKKYHIPNNQRNPIPTEPTVALLEYERRKLERKLSRKPSSTPVKTPGKKSRVPPSTPRTPHF